MIVPVMAISNLVLTRQMYSEETNGAHAHNRDRVPLRSQTEVARWLVIHDKCLKTERDMRHTSGSVARSMAR